MVLVWFVDQTVQVVQPWATARLACLDFFIFRPVSLVIRFAHRPTSDMRLAIHVWLVVLLPAIRAQMQPAGSCNASRVLNIVRPAYRPPSAEDANLEPIPMEAYATLLVLQLLPMSLALSV